MYTLNKVIFLDHYGVMIPRKQKGLPTINELRLNKPFDSFNIECINCLKDIVKETNCDIVVTSDWSNDLIKLKKFYKSNGIIEPIDVVKIIGNRDIINNKSESIIRFIQDNIIINYVIIDDLELNITNFILCYDGITNYKDQIINLLNDI